MSRLLPSVVEKAIRTATSAHRRQKRKGSDLPYIAHPAAVASILVRAGFDDDAVIAAAWLHDVVEDTPTTMDEIRAEFPPEVSRIVDAMSERKTDSSGEKISWQDRKALHIARMQAADSETKAIMLADKLHNLISMRDDAASDPPGFWDRFNASRKDLLTYYRRMIATAEGLDGLDELRSECRRLIDELSE